MLVTLSLYVADCVNLIWFMNCRMPIIDKFKDMGTVVMGKVESGSIREGDSLIIMPNKVLSRCLISISFFFNINCQIIDLPMTFMDQCRNL